MLQVILHLFLLHPIFNFIKTWPKTPLHKRLTYAVILLSAVTVLTVSQYERKQNFYDLMAVSPRGFS